LDRKGDSSVTLSPTAYKPLFLSREMMICALGIGLLSATYWLFVAMAPILYMDSLGVSLSHFGFYQGAICGVFSMVSLLSPRIFARFGQRNLLIIGIWLCGISGALLLTLGLFVPDNPVYITAAMMVFSVGAVFPCNIIYPLSLNILPNSSGRAAALTNGLRLLLTALTVQGVGIVYEGYFKPIGIVQFFAMSLGIFLTAWAMRLGGMKNAINALSQDNSSAADNMTKTNAL
jgi:MFS transporter, DHA1 family, multidrug resistance protein